jgi:hypothetical protein
MAGSDVLRQRRPGAAPARLPAAPMAPRPHAPQTSAPRGRPCPSIWRYRARPGDGAAKTLGRVACPPPPSILRGLPLVGVPEGASSTAQRG